MTTPNKNEVLEKAIELYRKFNEQRGAPELAEITPEPSELAEEGFLEDAKNSLMCEPFGRYEEFEEKKEIERPRAPENLARICESARDVPFDVSLAVDSGFYISGTSQSGKTNLAKLLTQKLLGHGITCYVLDPSKAWTHDSPIQDVLRIDTQINQYCWRGSTIFDISALNARQKVIFVNQLCRDIYAQHVDGFSEKEFLIFEEAQAYLQQGSMRLATRKANPCENILDVVTTGANYGIRFALITQFPAMVDKCGIKITQQRYFGWTWERNDVNYVKAFIGKEWTAKLCALQKGEFIYQCRNDTQLIRAPLYGKNSRAEGKAISYDFPVIQYQGVS